MHFRVDSTAMVSRSMKLKLTLAFIISPTFLYHIFHCKTAHYDQDVKTYGCSWYHVVQWNLPQNY